MLTQPQTTLLAAFSLLAVFFTCWLLPRRYISGLWPTTITAGCAVGLAFTLLEGPASLGLSHSFFSVWTLPQVLGIVLSVYTVKLIIVDCLASRLLKLPAQDFSEDEQVYRNPRLLASNLKESWVAAIGEEIVFRGFLQTATSQLTVAMGSISSISISIVLPALLFGIAHFKQGAAGVLTATTVGLCFGTWFQFNGGNLWPLLIAHGIINSLTYIAMYFIAPDRLKPDA